MSTLSKTSPKLFSNPKHTQGLATVWTASPSSQISLSLECHLFFIGAVLVSPEAPLSPASHVRGFAVLLSSPSRGPATRKRDPGLQL